MDAAYVAERVMTLEELRTYVDRHCPVSATLTKPHPNPANPDEKALLEEARAVEQQFGSADRLRYLLGRRLARAGRWDEARTYFPAAWLPLLDRVLQARREAVRPDRNGQQQAMARLEEARLVRRHGMEVIGTEVEPDWRIHDGDFEIGVSLDVRTILSTNQIATSAEEMARARQHGVQPDDRWHYRAVGRALAREGTRRLREAMVPGQAPADRARALFAAAEFAYTNGIGQAWIDGQESSRPAPGAEADFIWQAGYGAASLAWEAARLLPDNTDETAHILWQGGRWIRNDPPVADLFYKSLVRRCRRTALGTAADQARWFPPPPKKPDPEAPVDEGTP
jgi:hypothetical protein